MFNENGKLEKKRYWVFPKFNDSEMNYIVEAGDFDILVGNSSRDEDLKNSNFNVEKTFYITD